MYYRDTEDGPSSREARQYPPCKQDAEESIGILCQVGQSDNEPAHKARYAAQHQC